MSASKGVWFVEGPDADIALYETSNLINMTLERVDQLETRQLCVLFHQRAVETYPRRLGVSTSVTRHTGHPRSQGIFQSLQRKL